MERITQLKPGQIFVFGSNLQGIHGKGAALQALREFGAISGQGEGLMGRSYGIPTRSALTPKSEFPLIVTLPLPTIGLAIGRFLDYARAHPEYHFLVTPIGCGLAGLEPSDIARYFTNVPSNVHLPEEFA